MCVMQTPLREFEWVYVTLFCHKITKREKTLSDFKGSKHTWKEKKKKNLICKWRCIPLKLKTQKMKVSSHGALRPPRSAIAKLVDVETGGATYNGKGESFPLAQLNHRQKQHHQRHLLWLQNYRLKKTPEWNVDARRQIWKLYHPRPTSVKKSLETEKGDH